MTDEGRQPGLFSLAPPPAPRPSCPTCGETAGVVRFGVFVCIRNHGVAQAEAAERVASMKARGRAKHLQQARRRRR